MKAAIPTYTNFGNLLNWKQAPVLDKADKLSHKFIWSVDVPDWEHRQTSKMFGSSETGDAFVRLAAERGILCAYELQRQGMPFKLWFDCEAERREHFQHTNEQCFAKAFELILLALNEIGLYLDFAEVDDEFMSEWVWVEANKDDKWSIHVISTRYYWTSHEHAKLFGDNVLAPLASTNEQWKFVDVSKRTGKRSLKAIMDSSVYTPNRQVRLERHAKLRARDWSDRNSLYYERPFKRPERFAALPDSAFMTTVLDLSDERWIAMSGEELERFREVKPVSCQRRASTTTTMGPGTTVASMETTTGGIELSESDMNLLRTKAVEYGFNVRGNGPSEERWFDARNIDASRDCFTEATVEHKNRPILWLHPDDYTVMYSCYDKTDKCRGRAVVFLVLPDAQREADALSLSVFGEPPVDQEVVKGWKIEDGAESEDDDERPAAAAAEIAAPPEHEEKKTEPVQPPPAPRVPLDQIRRVAEQQVRDARKAMRAMQQVGLDSTEAERKLEEAINRRNLLPKLPRQAESPPGVADAPGEWLPLTHPDVPFTMVAVDARQIRAQFKTRGKRGLVDAFVARTRNCVRYDQGSYFVFNERTLLWSEVGQGVLDTMVLGALTGTWPAGEELVKALGDVLGTQQLGRTIKGVFEQQADGADFASTMNCRAHERDLFPIADGLVVDLSTGTTRKRTFDDRFLFASPCTLLSKDDPCTQANEYLDALSCGKPRTKSAILEVGRRVLSASISHKQLIFMMGQRNSGRSLFCDLVGKILGAFACGLSSSILLTDRNDSNANTHGAALVGAMRGARAGFLSEIDPALKADVSLKKVSMHVGDNMLYVRPPNARQAVGFINCLKLILAANDLPALKMSESQLKNFLAKVFGVHFEGKFAIDEGYKNKAMANTQLHNEMFTLFVRAQPLVESADESDRAQTMLLSFSSDPVQLFVGQTMERCSLGNGVPNSEVVKAYQAWYKLHGYVRRGSKVPDEAYIRKPLSALLGQCTYSNNVAYRKGWALKEDVVKAVESELDQLEVEESALLKQSTMAKEHAAAEQQGGE